MAGIAGIITKKEHSKNIDLKIAFEGMMKKLAYSEDQISHTFSNNHCIVGNVIPVKSATNDHYLKLNNFQYHVFVDGLVFISDDEKEMLNKTYSDVDISNYYEYLPLLYDYYGIKFVNHITGCYNIFIYDANKNKHLLINDRLGYLPLYYYESDKYFIFSTKIESILATGLIHKVEFDQVTMTEHLLFNYPLSDNTYVKKVYTMPDASIICKDAFGLSTQRYWDIREFFLDKPLNKRKSIRAINYALKHSVNKLLNNHNGIINFSLTGGWDSRVVLSYLLPDHKHDINTYSFGASEADDIKVPEFIAEKEGFDYTPFRLDRNYLNKDFSKNAVESLLLSNGTRNYKRTHYVYSIKQIAQKSDTLLTGIFGDEVLKVGKPNGGNVISQNLVDFIESGLDVNLLMKRYLNSNLANLFYASKSDLTEELEVRLKKIRARYIRYNTSGEQYFAFRFTLNLRKYFGNEVNSYNDFVYCFSPFIDYDFLKEFSKTKYMVSRFPFEKPSIKLKAQSSWLYYKLTKVNQRSLIEYPSSRAFKMKDMHSIKGILKIVFSKIIERKTTTSTDSFNTDCTDEIFKTILSDKEIWKNQSAFRLQDEQPELAKLEDYYSLIYWSSYIQSNYMK